MSNSYPIPVRAEAEPQCLADCPFHQERQACIQKLQGLIPGLVDKAFASMDAARMNQEVRDITYAAVSEEGGVNDTPAAVGLGLDILSDNVASFAAEQDLYLADTFLESQERLIAAATESCAGPKAKKRFGLFGKTVMQCSSPVAKRYKKYKGDVEEVIIAKLETL
ncbi:MAG TPA: hypothetical protein VMT23_03900 [Candidatus Binatia bacterium]|nr:hypothetical protein [Candidatus Binatia bacterium]